VVIVLLVVFLVSAVLFTLALLAVYLRNRRHRHGPAVASVAGGGDDSVLAEGGIRFKEFGVPPSFTTLDQLYAVSQQQQQNNNKVVYF
jgi:hypothetical protein